MRFVILPVLSRAFFGFPKAQITTGEDLIPITWDSNNKQLVAILNYGVAQAVPKAIAAGQLSKGKWNHTNVILVQNHALGEMNFYDFIVEIEDGSEEKAKLNVIVLVSSGGEGKQAMMSLSKWAIIRPK